MSVASVVVRHVTKETESAAADNYFDLKKL